MSVSSSTHVAGCKQQMSVSSITHVDGCKQQMSVSSITHVDGCKQQMSVSSITHVDGCKQQMSVSSITHVDGCKHTLNLKQAFHFDLCVFILLLYFMSLIWYILLSHSISVHIPANSLHGHDCLLNNLVSCLSQTVPFYPKLHCTQAFVCILSSCKCVLNCWSHIVALMMGWLALLNCIDTWSFTC